MTNRAQTYMEYVIVLTLTASMMVAMRVYIQRGIQAALKNASDQFGRQDKANPWTKAVEEKAASVYDMATKTKVGIQDADAGRQTDIDSTIDTYGKTTSYKLEDIET